MPRILKSVASTTKEPAKVGSTYTSALIHKMPPGVPRYLAQKHADAKREVFESAFSLGQSVGIAAIGKAIDKFVTVEVEIDEYLEKRGKK
jgi:hypothetical protein